MGGAAFARAYNARRSSHAVAAIAGAERITAQSCFFVEAVMQSGS